MERSFRVRYLVLLASLIALAVAGSGAIVNSTDSQNLSEWRMGGRFMNGSRYWDGELNSSGLNLLWNIVNNERVYTDVTVVDGRAFWVTGGDTQEKFIIADANLGTILCEITLGERGNRNSVSILDGVAYVGFGATSSGNFSAFNADTCELLWYYVSTPRNKFVTGNLVYNGVVYTANFNQKYYALNASTGALIWATDSSRFLGEIAGFPTLIDNGSIAYLYYNTGTSLDCLYAVNGSIKWSQVFTAKATPGLIHDGYVWTCVDGTDYCYKFEYDTGTQVCNYSNADFGSLFAYPSLANDTLFLPSSQDGKLYAIDTDDCSNPYNVSLGNTLEGAGVVTQEYYYASLNNNHTVAVIDITDGNVDYAFRVVPNPLSLTIANSILYVGAYVDVAAYGDDSVVSSISSSSSSSSSSSVSSSSSSSSISSFIVSTSSSVVSSSTSSSLASSSLSSSVVSSISSTSSSSSSMVESSSSSSTSSSSTSSIESSSSSSSIISSSTSSVSSSISSSSISSSSSSSESSTTTTTLVSAPSLMRVTYGGMIRIHFLDGLGSVIQNGSCLITILDSNDSIIVMDSTMHYLGSGKYYYTPKLGLGDYECEVDCNKTINDTYTFYGAVDFDLQMVEGFVPMTPMEPPKIIEDPHFNEYGEDSFEQGIIDEFLSDNFAYQVWLVVYEGVFLKGAGFFTNIIGFVILVIETIFTIFAIFWASVIIIVFAGFFLFQSCVLIYSFTRSSSALDGFITVIRLQALPVVAIWRIISTVIPIVFHAFRIFFDIIKFAIDVILRIANIIATAIPL